MSSGIRRARSKNMGPVGAPPEGIRERPLTRRARIPRMSTLHSSASAVFALQILTSAFFAILFLQSGIDKVIDRRGNLEWLTGHFAKSPLAGMVPLLLGVITLMELAAGALSAVGCGLILFRHESTIAFYGCDCRRSRAPRTFFRPTHGQGIRRGRLACALFPGRDRSHHLPRARLSHALARARGVW